MTSLFGSSAATGEGGDVRILATSDGALKTADAGPAWTASHFVFNSTNQSAAATAVTSAPTAGEKLSITDLIISVGSAMIVTLTDEVLGTVLWRFYMAANSALQVTPRTPRQLPSANSHLNVQTSATGNIQIEASYYSGA